MTKNEIPALLPVLRDDQGAWIAETGGSIEPTPTAEIEWSATAVEGDHGYVTFSATAHSIEDLDAAIAALQALRGLAAQVEEVCGDL